MVLQQILRVIYLNNRPITNSYVVTNGKFLDKLNESRTTYNIVYSISNDLHITIPNEDLFTILLCTTLEEWLWDIVIS